jgi:hypothetical protein
MNRPCVRQKVTPSSQRDKWLRDQRGLAMVSVLMLVLLMFTLGGATLLYTLLDHKSTQHYVTGNQAFGAAEAGVLDVINTVNSRGIVNMELEVVKSNLISRSLTSMNGFSQISYQVTGLASGTDASNQAILTVTGKAPLEAERTITVNIQRSGFAGGPGALHLSRDTAVGELSGASFDIDGRNHLLTGTVDLTKTVAEHPGISTRNDTVKNSLVNLMTDNQKLKVQGLGYSESPPTPSVVTTASYSTSDLQTLVSLILSRNNGAINKISSRTINQQEDLGTFLVPRITRLTNDSPKIAGGAMGYGILIVDQDVEFLGNFTFTGMVLFNNPSSNGIRVGGSVIVNGSVWSPLPTFQGNGNMAINYCDACLRIADSVGNAGGGNVPSPVDVTQWG